MARVNFLSSLSISFLIYEIGIIELSRILHEIAHIKPMVQAWQIVNIWLLIDEAVPTMIIIPDLQEFNIFLEDTAWEICKW